MTSLRSELVIQTVCLLAPQAALVLLALAGGGQFGVDGIFGLARIVLLSLWTVLVGHVLVTFILRRRVLLLSWPAMTVAMSLGVVVDGALKGSLGHSGSALGSNILLYAIPVVGLSVMLRAILIAVSLRKDPQPGQQP